MYPRLASDLKFLCPSSSQIQGLQMCAMRPGWYFSFLSMLCISKLSSFTYFHPVWEGIFDTRFCSFWMLKCPAFSSNVWMLIFSLGTELVSWGPQSFLVALSHLRTDWKSCSVWLGPAPSLLSWPCDAGKTLNLAEHLSASSIKRVVI